MSGGIGCPDYIAFTKALRFHAASFAQISDYITNRDGADCAVKTNTGNNTPTVNAGPAYTIPKNTPFTLTATGGDPDVNDASNLTYVWEQFDAGGANFANPPYTDAGDPGTTTRPIFRPFSPTASPSRTFPSLTYILNNANTPPPAVNGLQTAENLPQIGRIINFRATIRDNRGGVNDSSVVLTVDGNSGPFLMTAPNTAVMWTGGTQQNVTWSVSNTNNAPISCANVKISLSTDGGLSFPTVLAASTPNNGSAAVTVPNGIVTSTARIKVEAIGNIFFDISDANFSIILGDGCPVISNLSPVIGNIGNSVTITGTNFTGANAVKFSNNVTASFTVANDTTLVATVPAGAISGPITISKTGCTAAQTAAFTINPISTTITVKSNADSGGSCPGPTCTLRQAIAIARPGDTIGFDLSTVVSPITLTSTLTINKSLTIQGPGANLLTVSGNRAVRVFLIVGGDVTLSGLMIADGQGQSGGGIRKEGTGTLTILNSTLSGNSASEGGGIYNFSTGTTTVSNSTLSGNSATDGGGILNIGAGTVNITTSLLSGNTVTSNGGGINNLGTGTVNVTSSTLSGNSARGNFRSLGGGIFNNSTGTVTITNSTLSGNSASGFQVVSGRGGGIFNNSTGTVTVTNSTLSGNTATSQGGGISFNSGTLNVKGSTLSGNSADFGGGLGIFNSTASLTNCTISGNSGSAWGAGILFYGDSGNRLLTLTNCTISDNISGGGSGVRTESLG
ncbi:MAG: hypothetical protein M3X11_25130, partial [Acidobacteriota bacterium]|nr:hypothetical protein [Acidobacteriota bacterium]